MSIFNSEIFKLTKKKILTNEDKIKIKSIKTRFSLERFYFYKHDFKKGYLFQDIDYSRLSYYELLNLCCS